MTSYAAFEKVLKALVVEAWHGASKEEETTLCVPTITNMILSVRPEIRCQVGRQAARSVQGAPPTAAVTDEGSKLSPPAPTWTVMSAYVGGSGKIGISD